MLKKLLNYFKKHYQLFVVAKVRLFVVAELVMLFRTVNFEPRNFFDCLLLFLLFFLVIGALLSIFIASFAFLVSGFIEELNQKRVLLFLCAAGLVARKLVHTQDSILPHSRLS